MTLAEICLDAAFPLSLARRLCKEHKVYSYRKTDSGELLYDIEAARRIRRLIVKSRYET